ncbi:hypothetical protein BDB01DRAFT_899725 [Pilobolus umbonatus]|nr:hypothetical protein BDB01DRAFT_899725 [Pilobolus umbonatus]
MGTRTSLHGVKNIYLGARTSLHGVKNIYLGARTSTRGNNIFTSVARSSLSKTITSLLEDKNISTGVKIISTWGQEHLYMVSRASLLDGKNISTRDRIIFTWGQELIYLGVQSQLFCEIKHIFLLGEGQHISTWETQRHFYLATHFSDRSFIVSGKYKITREQTIIHPLDLVMSSIQGGTNGLLFDKAHTGLFHKAQTLLLDYINTHCISNRYSTPYYWSYFIQAHKYQQPNMTHK